MPTSIRELAPDTPDTVVTDDGRRLAVPPAMTLEEFEAFPWPEGSRWELIEGVPVLSPSPIPAHQLLLLQISRFLDRCVDPRFVLPGVDLAAPGSRSYVCPDLMIHDNYAMNERPLRRPPRLAIEILSPSTRRIDLTRKRGICERAGVLEYWTADPASGVLQIHNFSAQRHPAENSVDADGFVDSQLLSQAIRITRLPDDFRIETRPLRPLGG